MGFRFRKSVSLGPVRVNLSKSGIGYSVGTKGARVTKKANGGTRTTLSVPGTGINYTSESSKKKTNKQNNTETAIASTETGYNLLAWVCKIIFIPMILLSLVIAIINPLIGILGVGVGIIEFIYQKNYFANLKNKERA